MHRTLIASAALAALLAAPAFGEGDCDVETQIDPPSLQIEAGPATVGGADAETIDAAETRIPETLRHKGRAVSEEDFEEIAAGEPGADIGRASVLGGGDGEDDDCGRKRNRDRETPSGMPTGTR